MGQEKVFGQVRLIEASLGYKSGDPTEWRLKKAIAGGGPLMDIGIYCVQSSRYVSGKEPVSVTAQFGPITNKKLFSEVEESITWQLEFPGGLFVILQVLIIVALIDFLHQPMKASLNLAPALVMGPSREQQVKGN